MSTPYLLLEKSGPHIRAEGLYRFCAGSRADGLFAEWHWDGQNLVVENDRYGFWPAFYVAKPGCFAISTSVAPLVERLGSVDLDDVGMALFLRLGYFVGDRTPFRDIRVLPPSATVDWNDGNVTISGHGVTLQKNTLARDDAIDAYVALFSEAIRRRLPNGPFALPLSGGRDSRHILLELCSLGYRPDWCITAKTKDEEVRVAAALTHALGINHTVLEPYNRLFHAEERKNVLTSFGTTEHAWVLAMTDFLTGKVGITYDGLAGDVLSAGHFLTPECLRLFEQGNVATLAQELMPIDNERVLRSILHPSIYRRFNRDASLAKLEQELSRHLDAPNPVSSYFLANRTRRAAGLSPCCLNAQLGKVFCPYLDPDLFDFLASLPAAMFLDYTFHTEAIHRGHPRYAEIPFERKQVYSAEGNGTRSSGSYSRTDVSRRREQQRFALHLLRYRYAGTGSKYVRGAYLWPRLARCLLDPKYCVSSSWFLTPATYLMQLEAFCRRQATGSNALSESQ